ncbi:MAG: universal stress protein [Solirubrobacteraceae bacterium]
MSSCTRRARSRGDRQSPGCSHRRAQWSGSPTPLCCTTRTDRRKRTACGVAGPRPAPRHRLRALFQRILVAIDGSPHAARALSEAVDLAQRSNATLTVMTVVPDVSAWLFSGGGYTGAIDFEALAQESEHEHQQLLDSAVDALPKDLSVTKLLAHGRPAERILERRGSDRHDLVVMGSRGRGDVRSVLLGSVSHKVLNAGPGAVLIVHAAMDTG